MVAPLIATSHRYGEREEIRTAGADFDNNPAVGGSCTDVTSSLCAHLYVTAQHSSDPATNCARDSLGANAVLVLTAYEWYWLVHTQPPWKKPRFPTTHWRCTFILTSITAKSQCQHVKKLAKNTADLARLQKQPAAAQFWAGVATDEDDLLSARSCGCARSTKFKLYRLYHLDWSLGIWRHTAMPGLDHRTLDLPRLRVVEMEPAGHDTTAERHALSDGYYYATNFVLTPVPRRRMRVQR